MSNSARIAALNDALRRTLTGGRIYKTDGIDALEADVQVKILEAVRTFAEFTADNDPYGEHDFGAVDVESQRCFWKIDYFDRRDPRPRRRRPGRPRRHAARAYDHVGRGILIGDLIGAGFI